MTPGHVSAKKTYNRGERNRIGRREKWPKKSWEQGEIGGKVGGGRKRKFGSREN